MGQRPRAWRGRLRGTLCALVACWLACGPEAWAEEVAHERCIQWRGLRATSPWRADRYDPIPTLMSLRGSEGSGEGEGWFEVPHELTERGLLLQPSEVLDLTEGVTQRLYLVGTLSPCLISDRVNKVDAHSAARGAQLHLTLRGTHPLSLWVDGRGVALTRSAPMTWEARLPTAARNVVVRLSPLAGRPTLELSGDGWRLKPHPPTRQGPSRLPREAPKGWPAHGSSVRWSVEVKPFGLRVASFDGQVSSRERPTSLDSMRDQGRLQAYLAGACEELSVSRAGWRQLDQRPKGWRYRLTWRCVLRGHHALLVAERWRRPARGAPWSLDRGPPGLGVAWTESAREAAWRLTAHHRSAIAQPALQGGRGQGELGEGSGHLAAEAALSAHNLTLHRSQLLVSAQPMRGDAWSPYAPQTFVRRWGEAELPEDIASQLSAQERPLWAHFSYEMSPIARRTRPELGEVRAPLSVAFAQRARLSSWCAARGGAPPELIAWGLGPERPLPYLGLRCRGQDLSLRPTQLDGRPGLTPVPDGAWCVTLARPELSAERCAPPSLKPIQLNITWSAYGDTWRARWRHTPEALLPPDWLGATWGREGPTARAAYELAPADLLWETLKPPLSSMRPLGHLGWWSLPAQPSAQQRARLWREAISMEGEEVTGSVDVFTLGALSPTAQIELLRADPDGRLELRAPLRHAHFTRVIELPDRHPAVPILKRVQATEIQRSYASYLRPKLLKRSAAEGAGWRLVTTLIIARGAQDLSASEQLSFARAVRQAEQQLWSALTQPSVDADAEVRDVLEDWGP